MMKSLTNAGRKKLHARSFLVAMLLVGSGLAGTVSAQVRTNEGFPFPRLDHPFVHSGTHLQGVRASEKWAGGLIFRPAIQTGFQGMSSVVIVNNPDPVMTMTATVDFFDSVGTLVGSTVLTIPPEGFDFAPAATLFTTFGFGSARVRASAGSPPLVGATMHNTISIAGINDQDQPRSRNNRPPGASSMQQLQVVQPASTRLWFGPMPLSLLAGAPDFMDGNLPFVNVVNPNALQNVLTVNATIFDRNSGVTTGPFLWRNVTVPPFGTLTEISGQHLTALGTFNTGLWNAAAGFAAPGTDLDLMLEIVSNSGLPILGDGYGVDLTGPEGSIRMASAMLASTPTDRLLSPEFTIELPNGIIQTLIGVFNVGPGDAGPLTVLYLDNNGAVISQSNIASLPAGQSLRVEPTLAGYPSGTQGFGSAQIVAASGSQLVGHAVREILEIPGIPGIEQWHKAYGESLLQLNGVEPGPGWVDPVSGMIRKISPLVRVDPGASTAAMPGYTTFGNFALLDVLRYNWSFWSAGGAMCGFTPFPNLPFLMTSWTYEDSLATQCGGPINLSGRVDHQVGRIEGIKVLGYPLDEFGIRGFPTDPPVYEGPGDIVP